MLLAGKDGVESRQALNLQSKSTLTVGIMPMLILYHDGSKAEATLAARPKDSVGESESDCTNRLPLRGKRGRVTTGSLLTMAVAAELFFIKTEQLFLL